MTTNSDKPTADAATDKLPTGQLKEAVQNLAGAMGERALSSVTNRLTNTTERLNDYAQGSGGGLISALTGSNGDGNGLGGKLADVTGNVKGKAAGFMFKQAGKQVKDKVKGVAKGIGNAVGLGGGNGKTDKEFKFSNIVESIDVGVPVDVAYDQWTRFTDFPDFMKKVENVEQLEDEKLKWTAKVLWSHRIWESTIIEQVPDERIVWHSEGAKGYVDGAVTFHELTPDLTRILLVLEYHPQGLFEKTGNIWRAQGRRARLELKHFRRHVMTNTILHTDELEGWRGEIHDEQVVEDTDSDSADEGTEENGPDDETSSDESSAEEEEEGTEEAPEETSKERKPTSKKRQKT